MVGPAIENHIQDVGFRFSRQRPTWLPGPRPLPAPCSGMAALGTWLSSVRRLHSSVVARAGGQWRLQQGLAANPSGYGALTELPDWSFADGRPAPPMKGQLRRKAQREKLARRVVLLTQEMDAGLEAWKLRQQKLEEERKREHDLKPKGILLRSPLPNQ